ncbi:MAG: hypothetical protein LBR05_04635 [Azoarcus sp.]|jgi:ketosteroid isomerase-like protein|nr:hypothetical protein [Azoarcus sp.]
MILANRVTRRRALRFVCLAVLAPLFVACAKDDPQAALDAAASEFQAALEAKDKSRVLDLLHPNFTARDVDDDGVEWAKRTMTAAFLRYKNVTIVVPWRRNALDPNAPDRAATDAEATLVGADGMIPDDMRHYRVRLEWRRDKGDWKVARLEWE